MVMLLTLRGTPFLYYGDEIGMPDTDVPRERILDPGRPDPWIAYRAGCRAHADAVVAGARCRIHARRCRTLAPVR